MFDGCKSEIGSGPLFRISMPWMIEVVDTLDELDSINDLDNFDRILKIWSAKSKIESVFADSIYKQHTRVSAQRAVDFHNVLSEISDKENAFEQELTPYQIARVLDKKKEFRAIFIAELAVMPVYIVAEKECYNIDKLTLDGASLFPPSLLTKAPETKFDADETGKALAFELSTACGFHIFRVMEAVAKRYWAEATEGKITLPPPGTLGTIASELEKNSKGDEKIIESIKQITKLHRNPLIHPEAILSVSEAIETLGIARSVIGSMLAALPDVPQTTGASPLSSVEAA